MPAITSFWSNPPVPDVGVEGDLITSRGTDPLVDTGGENAMQPLWPNPPISGVEPEETANSVSGLPGTPNRFQPSEQPPPIPPLDRPTPGTIDEQ
jgi:hypothetical protein